MKPTIRSHIWLFLPLLYNYVGPAAFISYAYSFLALFSKWRYETLLTLLVSSFVFLTLYSKTDPIETLALIRYYWGWILFYVFFSVGFRININLVLKVLSLAVLGEAILINTIFPASFWPNFTSSIILLRALPAAHSFGGNASVTSVILLSLFVCS